MAARRKIRLATVGNIWSELCRCYRRADAGEMEWSDACKAAHILRELRTLIESTDLEQRVSQLETRLEGYPAKSNGGMSHAPTYR